MNREWQEATNAGDCKKVCSLLDSGANIDALDKHGQTALMNAAHRGDTSLARLLVQRGAKLDITAKYRLTALMLAVINQHVDIVRILVEAGADTSVKGSGGSFACTPLEYARKSGNDEIVRIFMQG